MITAAPRSPLTGADLPADGTPTDLNQSSRPWALILIGVVVVRIATTGHGPNLVDAGTAGVFSLLLFKRALHGKVIDRSSIMLLSGALIAALLSVVSSLHPLISAWAVPGFLAPWLAFVTLRRQAPWERRFITIGVTIAGALHSLVALYQRFVIYPDALARADERRVRTLADHGEGMEIRE